MDEQLPRVEQPRRIELTADQLPPAGVPAAAVSAPPAPVQPSLPAVKQPAAPANATAFCQACGSPIDPRAVMCTRCGVPQQQMMNQAHTMAALTLNQKSNGMAILLTLLFVGAGHWYLGRVGRGFAFLAAYIVAWVLVVFVVGLFLIPIVGIWAAIDASRLANKHNAQLLTATTGVVPGMTL